MSESTPPGGPSWPEKDLRGGSSHEADTTQSPASEADPSAGPDASADETWEAWDARRHLDRRRPTTAEQAVPWLIGIILAQSGMLIVLLALIFTGTGDVGGNTGSPTPTPFYFTPPPSFSDGALPSESAAPSESGPTPTPAPVFGPLEMVYLGRATPVAPIELLRRDFSTSDAAVVMASDSRGVDRMTWSPDGRLGAILIEGELLVLSDGADPRSVGTQISTATFSPDGSALYAVRIVRSGGNDVANILGIDVVSGENRTLATVTYTHPEIINDPPLREAQYADNGGIVRVWATVDDTIIVYILGAPSLYQVDPVNGNLDQAADEPTLASPNRRWEVVIIENSTSSSTLQLTNRVTGEVAASVDVAGLVSHVRWAPTSNEIVFTLGYLSPGGGVRQDLYVWDLGNGNAPDQLTNNGASFGAEWLGTPQAWIE